MPAPTPSGSPLSNDPLLRDVPEVGGKKFLPPALLESRLGHGGWGAVYRGLHLDLRRDVAVKVLKSDVQGDENLLRFQREARLAIELTHRNVVRVHDLRHEYGLSYIVMEFVEGRSAQALIDQRGPLSEREAAKIALYVTRGLATAHKHREVIVHRDIKPGNILISDQGEVKLADLGLAKAIERAGEATFKTMGVIGTPAYMPPEQWRLNGRVTPRTDVWAMGATLYFLVTGRAPFRGDTVQIQAAVTRRPFPDVSVVRPDTSEAFAEIVRTCTQADPEKRYADATALGRALEEFLRTSSNGGAQPPAPRTAPAFQDPIAPAPAEERAEPARSEPETVTSAHAVAEGPSPSANAPDETVATPPPPPRRRRGLLLASGAVALVVTLASVRTIHAMREPKAPDGWVIVKDERGYDGWAKEVREPRTGIEFILVEPTKEPFLMGSPPGEVGRDPSSEDRVETRIERPFYLARTETTWEQFEAMQGARRRPRGARADMPAHGMTWQDAMECCLSIDCTLPCEIEWEYAARAGQTAAYPWGNDPGGGAGHANVYDIERRGHLRRLSAEGKAPKFESDVFPFDDECSDEAPVGRYAANAWGFHDMIGNVWEWTRDSTAKQSHQTPCDEHPTSTPDSSPARVVRGGSFDSGQASARLAHRFAAENARNQLGFRASRSLP